VNADIVKTGAAEHAQRGMDLLQHLAEREKVDDTRLMNVSGDDDQVRLECCDLIQYPLFAGGGVRLQVQVGQVQQTQQRIKWAGPCSRFNSGQLGSKRNSQPSITA
jgi:hypothetical protein